MRPSYANGLDQFHSVDNLIYNFMTATPRQVNPSFLHAERLRGRLKEALDHGSEEAIQRCVGELRDAFNSADVITQYKLLTDAIECRCALIRDLLRDALRENPSALVRHEAAFGLGMLGDVSDAHVLVTSMLSDPHLMVRHEAAIALAVVGDENTISSLENAIQEYEPSVIESAKYAIQQIELKQSKRNLTDIYK